MIGKAERGPEAVASIRRHGAAYLLCRSMRAARVVAFEDPGRGAIREFERIDLPVTVAVDLNGRSIHVLSVDAPESARNPLCLTPKHVAAGQDLSLVTVRFAARRLSHPLGVVKPASPLPGVSLCDECAKAQSFFRPPRSRPLCLSGSTRGSRWHSMQFWKFWMPSSRCS